MVKLIDGGVAVDDRGQLSFVNDFNFENVKRLKAELSNPNSNLNKDKLIERFEQDYGPGSAARAGVF